MNEKAEGAKVKLTQEQLEERLARNPDLARRNQELNTTRGVGTIAEPERPRAWQEWEITALKALYSNPDRSNFSINTLAERLGRTFAAVACKADELGITQSRTDPKQFSLVHCQNMSKSKLETCKSSEVRKGLSERAIRWHQNNPHPKGFKGHRRTPEEIEAMKKGVRDARANPDHRFNSEEYRQELSDRFSAIAATRNKENAFSRTKRGIRKDLGLYFRSSWEANYARYLNLLIQQGHILSWSYEPETFWFTEIKRGCRSYLPDFKVMLLTKEVEYHEVKGWMTARSKTALKRMAKYYPEIKLVLIDSIRYKSISKSVSKIIKNWE